MRARNGSGSVGASDGRSPSRRLPHVRSHAKMGRSDGRIMGQRVGARYGPNAALELLASQHHAAAAGRASEADVRADARDGPGVAATGVRLAEDDAISR